jgi:hypothetical protein
LLPVLINPNGYAHERVLRVRFGAGTVYPVADEVRFFELHGIGGISTFLGLTQSVFAIMSALFHLCFIPLLEPGVVLAVFAALIVQQLRSG